MSGQGETTPVPCPGCGEPVGRAERCCGGCGRDLWVARTPVGGPLGPLPGSRPCVACGSAELDQAGVCEHCGQSQPAGRDRMEYRLEVVAGVSDRGRHRARNEDSMAFAAVRRHGGEPVGVAVVCDGVASSDRADQASQAAADAAVQVLVRAALAGADPAAATTEAVAAAVAEVSALAEPDVPGTAPSCTFISAVVQESTITVGWVGDSRVYWLDTTDPADTTDPGVGNGSPVDADAAGSRRLTTDDTVAAQLVAAGMAEAEAARVYHAHALSRWIGADAGDVQPHVLTLRPETPGLLLLCSDGLWNYLPRAEQLAATLRSFGAVDLFEVAARFTEVAIDSGGHDNVTTVVLAVPPLAG